jgi:hypothetical protein
VDWGIDDVAYKVWLFVFRTGILDIKEFLGSGLGNRWIYVFIKKKYEKGMYDINKSAYFSIISGIYMD